MRFLFLEYPACTIKSMDLLEVLNPDNQLSIFTNISESPNRAWI